ncbi:hypothetical protein [Lactobacillus sp.]|uniref:hypothetical protein n=1 Tax=Lactobacillus sp. TaxID=1591 RepID=UPI00258ADC1A|nr:hypothetical protein [Lactobacillus sp.]MCO6529101.1 hypothetical protein [Lactobacillus sp.]
MEGKNTMNNVHEHKKTIGNWSIEAKIDLRPKTIVKTIAISVVIVLAIMGVKNGFK